MDTSDVGVGERKPDIDLPNCYFSKTFDKDQQQLSTIEKNTCLIVIFEAFWCTFYPFVVFTDHNTVTFIKKCKIKITDKRYGD